MFRTTFLGHQGWLFRAGHTQILVDPLLEAGTGDIDSYWMKVYPPRRLDFEALAPVSAVVITHEHTDHFHVPSLMRLDRRIPIVLSSMMSTAARRILSDLGFTVRTLSPGTRAQIGEIELIGLHPDGRTTPHELDVLPMLVRDRAGHGSFFTSVDLSLTPSMAREARQVIPRPGVWTHCCNDLDMSPFYTWLTHEPDQSAARAGDWADQLGRCFRDGQRPELVLVYGGGFSFDGSLDPMNARIFNCDPHRATTHLASRMPGWRCHAALPGETIVMRDGRVVDIEPPSGFVTPEARENWPVHTTSADPMPLAPPSCGRTRMRKDERALLSGLLDELARFLFAGPIFSALFGIGPCDTAGRLAAIALWLRDDDDTAGLVFAYDPQACAFHRDGDVTDPAEKYVAGVECWATDLIELLRVERSPGYVVFGHMRFWNAAPQRLRIWLDMAFFLFCHPLLHPDRFYALYRAQAERAVAAHEKVRAHESSP